MDSVVWWQEDDAERPIRLLAVGPGSPPRSDELWVHYWFEGRPAPGGWALASIASLEPLSEAARAAAEERPAQGGGSLRQIVIAPDGQVRGRFEHVDGSEAGLARCRREAGALLAQRLADPTVAAHPKHAGVWLSRLRVGQGALALDVAPAAAPEGGDVAVSLRVLGSDRPRFGVQGEGHVVTWCEGEMAAATRAHHHVIPVQIEGEQPVELPALTSEWTMTVRDGPHACHWQQGVLQVTRPPGAAGHVVMEARVPLRECSLAEVCERWREPSAGVPLGSMTLRAPLPR